MIQIWKEKINQVNNMIERRTADMWEAKIGNTAELFDICADIDKLKETKAPLIIAYLRCLDDWDGKAFRMINGTPVGEREILSVIAASEVALSTNFIDIFKGELK